MARTTKRDFFRGFGITMNKGGKIFSPWGEWVTLPLTWGSKTHCYGWSTLAGTREWTGTFNGEVETTHGTCVCQCDHCYASCGRYVMPSNVDANIWRTFAARYCQDWLESAITAQILWGKRGQALDMIRVHISGDFFSPEYVDMWHRIAERCSETRFWAYTKVQEYETRFDDMDNFNIVRSIVPGMGFNFGTCAEVMAMHKALTDAGIETHICRCAVDKEQHCNSCSACSKLRYVLFLMHGDRTYNPENDPLWGEFQALVNSQKSLAA